MSDLYRYMILVENPNQPNHYERVYEIFRQWGDVVGVCQSISYSRPGGANFLILRGTSEATLDMAYQRLIEGDTLEVILNDYYMGLETMNTGVAEELTIEKRAHPTLRDMLGIQTEKAAGTLANQMSRILKPTSEPSRYQNGNPPETVPFVPEPGSWTRWKWQHELVEVTLGRIGGKYDGLPAPELPDR